MKLGRAFQLEAHASKGGRALTKFTRPLRLVVRYTEADVAAAGGSASALRLFYQDDAGGWVAIPTTVDPAASTLNATIDHFTVFAVGASACELACDDFERADATELGTAIVGGAWQLRPRDTTTFGICGGLACASTSTGDGAYATIDAAVANHAAEAALVQPTGATATAGIVIRSRPSWDRFLLAEVSGGGLLTLWRYDGAWNPLGTKTLTLAAGSRHVLGAQAYGATIAVTWDGVQQILAGDVDDPTATRTGVYVGTMLTASGRPTLDDFSVKNSPNLGPAPAAAGAATCATAVTGASDQFKRTTSGELGCADSGQAWEMAPDTAWTICSGVGACPIAPAGGDSWARIQTNLTAQRITASLAAQPAGATGGTGVALGLTPDWQAMVYVGLSSSGVVEVWTLVSGNWSSGAIASAASGKPATAARTLEARRSGTSLTVLVDGVSVLGPVAVPTPPADGTQAGMYAGTSGPAESWPRVAQFVVVPGP